MTIATKVWIVQLIELYCISQRGAGGGAVLGEDVPPVLLQPAVPQGGLVRAGGLLAQRRPQHQHPHLRGRPRLHRHRAQPPRLHQAAVRLGRRSGRLVKQNLI